MKNVVWIGVTDRICNHEPVRKVKIEKNATKHQYTKPHNRQLINKIFLCNFVHECFCGKNNFWECAQLCIL